MIDCPAAFADSGCRALVVHQARLQIIERLHLLVFLVHHTNLVTDLLVQNFRLFQHHNHVQVGNTQALVLKVDALQPRLLDAANVGTAGFCI